MEYQQSIASKSIIVQLHTYVVAIIACLLGGCQDSNDQAYLQLNENELCFTEKLISISENGNKYYIGTESSGNIYVYSPEKYNLIDTLSIDCGRIYKVREADNENAFFVGTQNMGLKYAHKAKNGNKLIIDTSYIIKGKGDRYSCYDIYFDNDAIYAMTSHGIFRVFLSDTILHEVFADYKNETPKPLVASNMIKVEGDLFAATAEGLKRITPKNNFSYLVETILHKNISFVEYHNHYIYALADSLYKISPQSLAIIDTFGLSAPSKIYYYSDSINYFLSDNNIVLVHDTTLQSHEPALQKIVKPRRKLYVDGHNIISNSKEYSLLIADNALWQVGHHLPSVFGEVKKDGVKLTCTDGKSVYFLIGKKIYKLETGYVASEFLELEDKGDIRLMECSPDGKFLYYVNDDNEVFRQSLNTSWYQFWQTPPEYIGNTKKEITAMIIHKSVQEGANYGVILGIRDGIICMYNETKKDTIKLNTKPGIDSIPYIRRFASREADYYVPTMNEGLFFGKGKELEILDHTKKLQFIRDVAYSTQDSFPHFLTNKQIFIGNERVENNINYGSRLLLSGNELYIPGEVGGVRVINVNTRGTHLNDTILFSDIVFRPESSLELNGIVYLGGQSGVIALSPRNTEGNYPYHYITFKNKEVISRQSLMFVIFIVAIAFIISIVILVRVILNHKKREVLKTRLLELITEHKKLANKNNCKAENFDVNKAGTILLASKIRHYTRLIGIEKTMNRYRLLFTKHEDREKREKDNKPIITFDYCFMEELRTKHTVKIGLRKVNDGISKIFTTDVKNLLNKKENFTSEMKLRELNSIIVENKDQLLQDLKEHINNKIENLHELSQKEEDTELIQRLLTVFNRLGTNFERFSDNNADDLFKLIEEVTINDGRLEMYTQMNELRKKLRGYDGINDEISKVIKKFFAPIRYYHVDMEIIKQLCITSNMKEAPQQITESGEFQGPFILLAITMAKNEMPAKKDVEKYLQQSDKTNTRAYDCVETWLVSDFVNNLKERIQDNNDSIYSSALAFYISNLKEQQTPRSNM